MVFKIIQENKLMGFTYYPLLENILGVFFLFMSLFVPILFFNYNGFKLQQWDEWLFLLVFFLIFFFLGINLGYQNMKVELINNTLYLRQDMRAPEVKLTLSLSEWNGVIQETKKEKGEDMSFIKIKQNSEIKDFYQSRSIKEANQMVELLNLIYKDNKGEQNGTK